MRFHPLNISFVKTQRYKNAIIHSSKEDLHSEDTISLISFTPEEKVVENVSTFYVGDIFYSEDKGCYIIFTLNKGYVNDFGINSFGFSKLLSFNVRDKIEFYPKEFNSFSNTLKTNSKNISLDYIGNVFMHEEIILLFNRYVGEKNASIAMFCNQIYNTDNVINENNIFYINNFSFYIYYDRTENLDNQYGDNWKKFDTIDKELLWYLENNDWAIMIHKDFELNDFLINDLKNPNDLFNTFYFSHATGTLYTANYNAEEIIKKINSKEEKPKIIKSLKHYNKFFLKLGSNGLISTSFYLDDKEYDIEELPLPFFSYMKLYNHINYYEAEESQKNIYIDYLLNGLS